MTYNESVCDVSVSSGILSHC